jgi:hypothetical protein
MIDTKIELGVQEYKVQLSICMQMNLDLYVEPIPGEPDTYEDEHKEFIFDRAELQNLVTKAKTKSMSMQFDVFKCMGYEAAGLSYQQLHTLLTYEGLDHEGITDKPYTASEDLVFLYSQLHILWDFVYEVECLA